MNKNNTIINLKEQQNIPAIFNIMKVKTKAVRQAQKMTKHHKSMIKL